SNSQRDAAGFDRVISRHSPRNNRSNALHPRCARGQGFKVRHRIGTDRHGDARNSTSNRETKGKPLSERHAFPLSCSVSSVFTERLGFQKPTAQGGRSMTTVTTGKPSFLGAIFLPRLCHRRPAFVRSCFAQ